MKKTQYIFAVLFFVATASCAKEMDSVQNDQLSLRVLSATQEETKSHLGTASEGMVPVLFDATDALWVIDEVASVGSKFTTSVSAIKDEGRSASFTGSLTGSGPFVAVFPYEYVDASSTKDLVVINVPSTQTYTENSFGINSNLAAAAWTSGNSFTLRSMFGTISLKVCGTCSVKKVVLEDNDADFALWGKCTSVPDCGAGDMTDISVANDSLDRNVLTITLDSPVALVADTPKTFNFVVPAGAFAKGMTMTLYDNNNKVIKTVSTSKNLTVARNSICRMAPVTISDAILFSGGAGTEENPYRIATVEDLKLIASFVNTAKGEFASAVYSQTRDIKDAALVDHIGTNSNYFKGKYHGNGYKITNITFSGPTNEKATGLFGTVKDEALIDHLTIDGYIAPLATDRQGCFVGLLSGSTVDNCNLVGSAVTLSSAQSGGIVGRADINCTVSNCKVSADVTLTRGASGGVVGLTASGATVRNCEVTSNIKSTYGGMGGILGYCESTSGVFDCTFKGNIVSEGTITGGIVGLKNNREGVISGCLMSGTVSGTSSVGGIVGATASGKAQSLTINSCTVTGSVTGSEDRVGGIVGSVNVNYDGSFLKVDKCFCNSDVTGAFNVGGIAGFINAPLGNYVRIINCVCRNCTVKATGNASNAYVRVGGILGGTDSGSKVGIDVLNSCTYGIRLVSETTEASTINGMAGIVGSFYSAGNIAVCYSSILDTDIIFAATTLKYKGGIVGYNKSTLYNTDYFNSANKYGAFYSTNPCVGISTAQFTDGTLLANLNEAAKAVEGAATWEADKSGYPIPSGIKVDPGDDPAKTIRILAIGNSFSCDAVEQYLYEIFADAGYNAIIGDCYIGGCTLEKHWTNEISTDAATRNSNSYRKIVRGLKSTIGGKSIAAILDDEPWDYVIFQQGNGLYGVVDSHYPYLTNLLGLVANHLQAGKYKVGYQQNWAFPKSCTNARFDLYDRDQDKMYKACVNCAETLRTTSSLDVVIPTGTAIQNGRTTSLGDTFNRDWGHLDYNFGRYTASCTWFEAITGIDVTTIKYRPSTVSEATAVLCRKAVHDAVLNPLSVTKQ